MADGIEIQKPTTTPDTVVADHRTVTENQSGAPDSTLNQKASTFLVDGKKLPDLAVAGQNQGDPASDKALARGSTPQPLIPQDVLSDADLKAVTEAKSKGVTKFDDAFYRGIPSTERSLPDFGVIDARAKGSDHSAVGGDLFDRAREILSARDKSKPTELPVEVRHASPEFAKEVQKQFDTLPGNVRRLLAHAGYKLVVAGKTSDAYPALKGVTPRGWPPGTTWDDADATNQRSTKEITINETYHNNKTNKFERNPRVEGGVKHETGHAVDIALGDYSHTDEFKKAYDQDVARMTPAERARFKYLLQPGQAGHEETFAELFGAINGSSANAKETQALLNDFPAVKALIQRRLAQLP